MVNNKQLLIKHVGIDVNAFTEDGANDCYITAYLAHKYLVGTELLVRKSGPAVDVTMRFSGRAITETIFSNIVEVLGLALRISGRSKSVVERRLFENGVTYRIVSPDFDGYSPREKELFFNRLVSSFVVMFPQQFSADTMEPGDFKIFKALFNNSREEIKTFIRQIDEYVKTLGLEQEYYTALAKKLTRDSHIQRLKNLEFQAEQLRDSIDNLRRSLRNRNDQLETTLNQIFGLKYRKNNDGDSEQQELGSYLAELGTSGIEFEETDAGVRMYVERPLSIVDMTALDEILETRSHPLFQIRTDYNNDDVAEFLLHAWKIRNVQIMCRCCFLIQDDYFISPLTGVARNGSSSYPQPHIYHYGCVGSYSESFDELSAIGDLYGITQTILNCAQSLNLYDSAVMRRFANDLDQQDTRGIVYKGKRYNLDEILKEKPWNNN